MNSEYRERMNVRAIRVTLRSALRHLDHEQSKLCIARALQLLEHARAEATSPAVADEIDALRAELQADMGTLEKEG